MCCIVPQRRAPLRALSFKFLQLFIYSVSSGCRMICFSYFNLLESSQSLWCCVLKIRFSSCLQMNLLVFLRLLELTDELLSFLQALLQMQEIPAAVSAIQFYENAQPSIRYAIVSSCCWTTYFWYLENTTHSLRC